MTGSMGLRRALGAAALVALSGTGIALAADPRLPPGQDPGGQAIAFISGGIDYASERIVSRVARDGEGEIVGWDFVDNDRFPYAATTATPADPEAVDATSAAAALVQAYAHGRMVPVRIASGDPVALARAIGFVAGTPARIVAVGVPLSSADMRRVVREASLRFRDHLFVVAADLPERTAATSDVPVAKTDAAPAADTLMNLGNVLVVAAAPSVDGRRAASVLDAVDTIVVPRGSTMFVAPPAAPPRNDVEAVALASASAACQGHGRPDGALLGSAAKAATLDAARPLEGNRAVRLLDPMCWYGGKRM